MPPVSSTGVAQVGIFMIAVGKGLSTAKGGVFPASPPTSWVSPLLSQTEMHHLHHPEPVGDRHAYAGGEL